MDYMTAKSFGIVILRCFGSMDYMTAKSFGIVILR